MPQQITPSAQYRVLQVLYFAFFVSMVSITAVLSFVAPANLQRNDSLFVPFMAASLLLGGAAMFVRKKVVEPAVERLRGSATDASAGQRWMFGSVATFAMVESIVLLAALSHYIGTPWSKAGALLVLGAVIMLMVAPQRPE